MKRGILLLAVTLLAQSPKEQAISDSLLRQATPAENPAISAYVQRVGAQLAPDYRFAVVISDEPQPYALPARTILVPVQSVTNASGETEFLHALAHAIGHSALNHGRKENVFLLLSHQPAIRKAQFEAAADRFAGDLLQSSKVAIDDDAFSALQQTRRIAKRNIPSLLNH
jgi:hypothetical protein